MLPTISVGVCSKRLLALYVYLCICVGVGVGVDVGVGVGVVARLSVAT